MIGLSRGQNILSHYFDVHHKKTIKIEKIKKSFIHSIKAHRTLEHFTGEGVSGSPTKNKKIGIEFQHAQWKF